jgi:hypothetical protein
MLLTFSNLWSCTWPHMYTSCPTFFHEREGDDGLLIDPLFSSVCLSCALFVGSCPHRDRDYFHIGSNFWKFCLIRTDFTLGEPVFLVKVFRLLRLEWIFGCLECGHSR